jgi:hypothetical protein
MLPGFAFNPSFIIWRIVMPTLSTPTLTLGSTVSSKRDVTVAGTITFDAGDVGKSFRLEIKLFGEDKSGDKLPASDAVGDDLIYTYKWTNPFLIFPKAYQTFSVSAAGDVSYSEKRAIATTVLDEDTGNVSHMVGGVLLQTPRADEVYANVTLSGSPVTSKTATVASGFGV